MLCCCTLLSAYRIAIRALAIPTNSISVGRIMCGSVAAVDCQLEAKFWKSECVVQPSAGRYWFLKTDTIFLIWNRWFRYIYFAESCALDVLMRWFRHFLVLVWYKINKITYYLDLIIPFQTDIVVDIDIPIFRYCLWCFSKPILQFFCKTDTIYWFIAQHYSLYSASIYT